MKFSPISVLVSGKTLFSLKKERKDFIGKDKGLYTVYKVNSTL
jgi:hypothetical protein